MRNIYKIAIASFLMGSTFSSLAFADAYLHVAVANRNSSSISLVGLSSNRTEDFSPDGGYSSASLGFEFEPMYISQLYASGLNFVTVGDRKNSQVLFFGRMNGGLFARVPVGKGVIHQVASDRKVYVATDIEKGFNVLEYNYDGTISNRRFDLPDAYSAGKPHDIIVTKNYIYLSVQGIGHGDAVLQIDAKTLALKQERRFGGDVHLRTLGDRFALLEQETGLIRIIDASSFRDQSVTQGPVGIHGIDHVDLRESGSEPARTFLYATDIDQKDGHNSVLLYEISRNGKVSLLGTGSTPFGGAHNITSIGKTLFVTHSGEQSASVSVMRIRDDNQIEFVKSIFTGLNPFGITALGF